jgi:hypothetical protein
VPVDSLGGQSGLTNIQEAQATIVLTDIEDDIQYKPITYCLTQNYSNPFNPFTQIAYTIAKRGVVSLVVYDLLGRGVSILANEIKKAGSYPVMLNCAKLSRGMYFYTFRSGSFMETKKMLLMK